MATKQCEWCNESFERNPFYSNKQWQKARFCGGKCSTAWHISTGRHHVFKKGHKHSRETKKKLSITKLAEKNPNWKGGRILGDKYYIKVRVAPRTYKKEHRLVMEKHLGRELLSSEHVHHINGVKTDNRLENLVVLTKSGHHKIHNRWTKDEYGKLV